MAKQKRDPRKVQRQHKWKQFEAPWEEDPGPGFQEYKIDVASPPAEPGPPDVSGPDTRVTCFRCKRDTYRVINSRTEEEILANLPGEQWRRSQGRGDPRATPTILLVICPRCKHGCQLRQEVIDRIRHQKGED